MAGKHLILVYGTLKEDYGNHRVIEDNGKHRLLGPATTVDKFILSHGGIPYVTRLTDEIVRQQAPRRRMFDLREWEGRVRGELYEVDDAILKACDWLEGHPDHYVRTPIKAVLEVGVPATYDCEIYLYPELRGNQITKPDDKGIVEWAPEHKRRLFTPDRA